MTIHKQRLSILLAFVLALASACNLPGSPPPIDQVAADAIYTAAAQTLAAQLTQNAPQVQPSDTPMPPDAAPVQPPSDTPQPLLPSDTPTFFPTNTPAFTSTSAIPLISASINTNCRRGPSKLYDPPVGTLRVGKVAEVHGRNSDSSWWYIQNPDNPGQFCWVWSDTTTVAGNTGALVVVEPPPLPPTATFAPTSSGAFDPSFDNVHNCSGDPFAIFELDNDGGVTFESMRLEIDDLDADDEIYDASSNAPFMGSGGECPPGGDEFPDGKTFWVGGNIEDGGSGNDAEATITLCTKDDLKGICVSETVEFEIP
jgi:hypothetical protein